MTWVNDWVGFPHATPILVASLCIIAIAYRYYSAFLAAYVACLDDERVTPAHRLEDGQNYHPTKRMVLFGHHFAAISGAGPLIGPVLSLQYGFLPGLLWLLVGVCLAGAVQDMLVLAASVRRDGKSLAEIAREDLGPGAYLAISFAILFIVVIALAGLGFVVVKALGGEEVPIPAMTRMIPPDGIAVQAVPESSGKLRYRIPSGTQINLAGKYATSFKRPESFVLELPIGRGLPESALKPGAGELILPDGGKQIIQGSSWGLFTIAATIPIALLVSGYMYAFRPGKVIEASLLGAFLVLLATWGGSLIPGSSLEPFFQLDRSATVIVLCSYGFIASVLPVWLLLCPRDYISSFLKIGTIALLIVGTCLANPVLAHRAIEPTFAAGGPTFPGSMFPFVFICVMCGAISGFHALVASGTTPKMVDKESHVRSIGYGAMLLEGVVGIVALIAAASIDPRLYYDINVDLRMVEKFQPQIDALHRELGAAGSLAHLDLGTVEQRVEESLRGRTGGAVTLAVGMAQILTRPLEHLGFAEETVAHYWKYWFHFAIMFEALFILTTIDTGTRIARFLLQENLGKIYAPWGRTGWLPGALFSSLVITVAWGWLVATGSIDTIWPMFGIANQLLAVVALAVVGTWLIRSGRARYLAVVAIPMVFVLSTTLSAGVILVGYRFPEMMRDPNRQIQGALSLVATVFVLLSVLTFLAITFSKWLTWLTTGTGQFPAGAAGGKGANGAAAGN